MYHFTTTAMMTRDWHIQLHFTALTIQFYVKRWDCMREEQKEQIQTSAVLILRLSASDNIERCWENMMREVYINSSNQVVQTGENERACKFVWYRKTHLICTVEENKKVIAWALKSNHNLSWPKVDTETYSLLSVVWLRHFDELIYITIIYTNQPQD